MSNDLDPAGRFRHDLTCRTPELEAITGHRGDPMVRCPSCTRQATAKSLIAAARHRGDDSLDRPTFSPGTRHLVTRAALKGVPVAVTDRHGEVHLVRNLDALDRLDREDAHV